jgi:ABC-type branched-subunit amino acid transport system ATPase component/ABC-type branched-subunit amino acid transport system permease subunit
MDLTHHFSLLFLGLAIGMTYGLLAAGLVLVHRTSGVINFAHASVGLVGASAFALAVVTWGVPYYVALLPALAISAAASLVIYSGVIRRLDKAPVLMKVVATIGAGEVFALIALVINSNVTAGRLFPKPPWVPEFSVGAFLVTRSYTAMLTVGPLVIAGLAIFLIRSRIGMAIRGSAAHPDLARLAGISASRMSGLAWLIAGALSALTSIFVLAAQGGTGFGGGTAFSGQILVRALTAGVIARMSSLPLAVGAGLAIGVLEQELLFLARDPGVPDLVMLGVLLCALLVQRRGATGRAEEDGSKWLTVQPWRPLAVKEKASPYVRNLGRVLAAVALVLAVVVPIAMTSSAVVILVVILAFAIIGLSVGILSGAAGQISLGQFAIAAVGAVASWYIVGKTGNFLLALPLAALAGALASVILGVPALRIKGLMFAVATLAFAQSTPWVLRRDWLFSRGEIMHRPVFGSFAFDSSKRYYYFVLVFVVLCLLVAHRVWTTGVGRRYRALRDNEDNARAFGIATKAVLIEAFIVAGCLAGVGGALYAHALSAVSDVAFTASNSTGIVAMVALGGVGLVSGPLIGAFYIVGIPRWLPLDNAGLAGTSLGWLILILYLPGGLAQAIAPIRTRLIDVLQRIGRPSAKEGELEAPAADELEVSSVAQALGSQEWTNGDGQARSRRERKPDTGEAILRVSGLTKSFGGIKAVKDVSLDVYKGETLGLVGPNGAGKTTLFELIGGFTIPDSGTVTFAGDDITRLRPELRARRGLVRSFQDANLFPTLTVTETLMVALERTMPTRPAAEVAGWSRTERARRERAIEVVELLNLTRYADTQIAELSTGTRRVVELAAVVALQPSVVLLDEPSSGIAQRESESLGYLIHKLKAHLDMTLVIIEHDIPLVRSISDRIVALASGAVIADGDPASVLADPQVVGAYLGSDQVSVERSGTTTGGRQRRARRCKAETNSGQRCSRPAGESGYCSQHSRAVARR